MYRRLPLATNPRHCLGLGGTKREIWRLCRRFRIEKEGVKTTRRTQVLREFCSVFCSHSRPLGMGDGKDF